MSKQYLDYDHNNDFYVMTGKTQKLQTQICDNSWTLFLIMFSSVAYELKRFLIQEGKKMTDTRDELWGQS